MHIPLKHYKRIIIIGNSDNAVSIEKEINETDFIVRFNTPNPTCTLKADLLFVSNGATAVARKTKIFNNMLKEHCLILWRYTLRDILSEKYEKISLDRRLRFLLFFSSFKKINHLSKFPSYYLDADIQDNATKLVNPAIPSSGFLAISMFLKLCPETPIYIHNFTFTGWDSHNWEKEKKIVDQWLHSGKISLASSLIYTKGN